MNLIKGRRPKPSCTKTHADDENEALRCSLRIKNNKLSEQEKKSREKDKIIPQLKQENRVLKQNAKRKGDQDSLSST